MYSLTSFVLAFFAGILGALIGGTQTFICTGFIGILLFVMNHCGVDTSYLNEMLLNNLFLPCIIFNGAVIATAYASEHHSIRGVETGRSLAFTNDARVLLMGAMGGILGYLIFGFLNYFKAPVDAGAISVVIVGVFGRILFNKEKKYNENNVEFLKSAGFNFWTFQILTGLTVATVMSFFAKETGLYTIGFSISAFSLIFAFIDPAFPATHHTTLIAGYAVMQTGSVLLGIVFGLLAHMIALVFGMVHNHDCGTHIDPPAIAIGLLSLIIFVLF